ncbi:MAG: Crp/Fnr family transcriptional regulator [Magnetococcales bacterium]|nr:Crp/Fnr family transcriptional regulator [Magnetococcales bacterium]
MKASQISDRTFRETALFTALSEEQLARMRQGMRVVVLAENENLFDDQQQAERFFLLYRGQVKLFRLSANGAEKIIKIIDPGELFATAVMFMETRLYPVCADATRESVVLSFDSRQFLDILKESPETCFRVLADMSRRLFNQVAEIDSLCLNTASGRLVRYLLNQVPEGNVGPCRFQLGARKRVLASRLSIQPETFSRILGKLRKRGLIEVEDKTICIPDVEALREYGTTEA